MSFLALDDDRTLLEDALRFIDEFAAPDDPADAPLRPAQAPDGRRRRPKRVRDPAVYARQRTKQKDELLQLRAQAKQLERQLHHSRRALGVHSDSGAGASTTDESGVTGGNERRAKRQAVVWLAVAMHEQRKRRAAEDVNRQLRQALAAQTTASRSIAGLSDGYSSTMAMEIELQLNRFLLCMRSVGMGPPQPVRSTNAVSDMSRRLQKTAWHLRSEAIAALEGEVVAAVTHEYNIKHDPAVGAYAETRGAAPLGRELELVGDYLQEIFWRSKFPSRTGSSPDGKMMMLEKHDFVDLKLLGAPVRFSGVSIVLKSSEEDRLTLTYSSLLFHPSGKLCLRRGGWCAVQRSPVNPSSESVYRSCSRVAPDILDGVAELDGLDVGQVQSISMAAVGEQSKQGHQAVQRNLLLVTGRANAAELAPGTAPVDKQTAARHS